ncbi:MAG: hypothetical protein ACKOE4_00070 [Candidatus Kapaibacterium sp.]
MAPHRFIVVFGTHVLALAGLSLTALAQVDTTDPPNPTVLPSQFTPPVQRVFQVYGSIVSNYREKVKVVNNNGDTVEVDSIRPRSQVVTSGDGSLGTGDTLFMYSTLGMLSIDINQTRTIADAPFSGREAKSDTLVDLYRYLGFWLRIDVILSVPDDGNPVTPGPTVYAWPNPFRDVVRLRVPRGVFESIEAYAFALDGRDLGKLSVESEDDDAYVFVWNGTDPSGNDVASGTYIVRLLGQLPGSSQRVGYSAKIMRVR